MERPGLLRPLAALAGAFVVLLVLAEVGVRFVSDQLPPPTAGDTEELVRKHERLAELADAGQQPEVVFFGNSTIDAGIDPAAFSAASQTFDTAYNAALLGNTLDVPQRWIDEFVLPQTDPDVVVVGITPLDVLEGDRSDADAAIRAASFDVKFDEIDDGLLPRLTRQADDLSYLVRHRSSLREPATFAGAAYDAATGQEPPGDLSRPDGFWDQHLAPDGAVLAYRQGQLRSPNTGLVEDVTRALPSDLRLDRIDDVLERVGGTEAVVLIPPIAIQSLAGYGVPVERWREVAALIVQRADHLGVPTIDLSTSTTSFPDDRFYDPIHLNAAGAEQMSAQVASALDAFCANGTLTCEDQGS